MKQFDPYPQETVWTLWAIALVMVIAGLCTYMEVPFGR